MPRIVRLGIGFQHLFHVGHELAIRLGRDHPVVDFPLCHPVFFNVRRTVSWLIDSTISSATTCSANNLRVQFAKPAGGGPKRVAMTLASCSPSSNFGRGSVRGLPSSVTSKPPLTNRSRICSTVFVRQ